MKTVIVLFGDKIEAFADFTTFCKLKKVTYNTYKHRKFPFVYQGASLEKLTPTQIFRAIEVMGETIKIQEL
jgi:hypothetical protein